MSARNTGTPWPESCSAMSCSVLVLPVPVAPATRPCRLSTASGIRTGASGWAVPSMTAAPSSSAAPSKAYPARIVVELGVAEDARGARVSGLTRSTLCSRAPGDGSTAYADSVIFKAVGDQRPYPDHGQVTPRDWSDVPPRLVRLGRADHDQAHPRPRRACSPRTRPSTATCSRTCRVGGRRSTSRTACTGRSVPRFSNVLPCTPASSYSPDTGRLDHG